MDENDFQQFVAEVESMSQMSGITMSQMLQMPRQLQPFLLWLLRKKTATTHEIADYFEKSEIELLPVLDLLVQIELIDTVEVDEAACADFRYRVKTSAPPPRKSSRGEDFWKKLDEK